MHKKLFAKTMLIRMRHIHGARAQDSIEGGAVMFHLALTIQRKNSKSLGTLIAQNFGELHNTYRQTMCTLYNYKLVTFRKYKGLHEFSKSSFLKLLCPSRFHIEVLTFTLFVLRYVSLRRSCIIIIIINLLNISQFLAMLFSSLYNFLSRIGSKVTSWIYFHTIQHHHPHVCTLYVASSIYSHTMLCM